MRFQTMWYVRPAKAQTSLPICIAFASRLNILWVLKRLSLQLWTFFEIFYFLFKSFVKVELSYVFTINLYTIAENCTEKWIIL